MARHIRKKSAGRKAAITRLQRERNELRFMLQNCRERLREAGLPVRSPRLDPRQFAAR
jgi:hypothetical protein